MVDLLLGITSGWRAGNDTLTGIENVTGTGNDDVLIGDNADNVLAGGGGDDLLVGNGGNDTANGGGGFDQCDAEIELNCEADP